MGIPMCHCLNTSEIKNEGNSQCEVPGSTSNEDKSLNKSNNEKKLSPRGSNRTLGQMKQRTTSMKQKTQKYIYHLLSNFIKYDFL